MRAIVVKFGLISGAILAALMIGGFFLKRTGAVGFDTAEILGYSSMVLAFLLVFFGIRSYRESVGNGVIGFGTAFRVGILITLVTCVMYVLTWQVLYFGFAGDFLEQYTAYVLEKMRAGGAAEAAVAAKAAEMQQFARLYDNPLFNAAITFLEVFPVGLVMTLMSAAILRRTAEPTREAPAVLA